MMIQIGTSGFSYDDWLGCWYPPNLPRAKMFDYYAERFSALEVNSTYYRIPPPRMMESLVRRGAGRVTFAIKLPQEITHQGLLTEPVLAAFKQAIAPAQQSGTLGALLAQFPQRFHDTAEHRNYLIRVQDAFAPAPFVIEIRHASWQVPDALDFLRAHRVNLCLTDMPSLPHLPATLHEITGDLVYLRFHGRNAHQWHLNEYPGARYDYRYPEDELRPWATLLREAEPKAATVFAFFNNHMRASAPQNANQLAAMLGQKPPDPGYTDLFSAGP